MIQLQRKSNPPHSPSSQPPYHIKLKNKNKINKKTKKKKDKPNRKEKMENPLKRSKTQEEEKKVPPAQQLRRHNHYTEPRAWAWQPYLEGKKESVKEEWKKRWQLCGPRDLGMISTDFIQYLEINPSKIATDFHSLHIFSWGERRFQ